MADPGARRSGTGAVDFDLHGLAGIRLLDASPGDAAAVRRQLGPIEAPLEGAPDLVIRFVDRLRTAGRLRYLGLGEAAFSDDAFLVLRSRHKAPARVRIPLELVGGPCEIVCERGLPAVPLLIPILNLTVLAKGALPLHAAAFDYNGTGVVTTGWSKGGKTETLLAFMAAGAAYIGDEWVYVSGDGRRIHGIPEPIRLWDWHLAQLPERRRGIGLGDRARLRAIALARGLHGATPRALRQGTAPGRALGRLMPVLERQAHVDVAPVRLFGDRAIRPSGSFDRLFFVVSADRPDVHVEPVDPTDVARRMVFSLQHERLDFLARYLEYRFAFPGAANPLIEQAAELELQALLRVLAGKPTYLVEHPYPVRIASLFEALGPLCR
ncbi:MAG: hypothetical protein A2X23_04275 [Chloroflexi bacterium GWC2_73_18]|nr:MAG: hypothetical protein A2X23_04275 [Chloroflexi bacterium GWC2_73_18]